MDESQKLNTEFKKPVSKGNMMSLFIRQYKKGKPQEWEQIVVTRSRSWGEGLMVLYLDYGGGDKNICVKINTTIYQSIKFNAC